MFDKVVENPLANIFVSELMKKKQLVEADYFNRWNKIMQDGFKKQRLFNIIDYFDRDTQTAFYQNFSDVMHSFD